MPARCKSVELSIKKRSIESIATEGGSVPPRAEAHFPGQGNRWRLEGAGRRPVLGEAEGTLVPFEGGAGSRSKRVNSFTTTERATNSSDEDTDSMNELLDAFDEV
ncbi:hypothetical protein JG687_00009103 [Phytophthora cactorum]|uniref:Uncharacterized protein n=1 Tax=Phytophthora cactorum TaxID=29920 RepID=A0A8T1UD24_9STRA|nr:hypothetical protein GQ600_11236 [Phytophthora cactorum]KAG6958913.1 hypothetical protein JG687_00009103 [Phytophthora cactorum]